MNGRARRIWFGVGSITCALLAPLAASAITVTLTATQDAWMDQNNSPPSQQSVNHGGDTTLNVQGGNSTQVKRRSLVQFDLSSIAACATVSSASLRLQVETTAGNRTHGAHRVLKAWTESGVTWLKTDGSTAWVGGGANDASDSNTTASATASTGTSAGAIITWTDPILTADVGAFVADPSLNHGWLMRDEVEGGSPVLVTYDSRENVSVGAVPPQLEVTYALTDANCDDGNVCTTDTCTAGGCNYADNSLPCDDEQFCNGVDTCDGGECSLHAGDPCVGPDGDTDCAESCDEAADGCTAADPDGTPCRPAAGTCDVAETCSAGVCPSDGKSTALCRASAGDCDLADSCDGVGDDCPADAKRSDVCRPSSGDPCDPADSCDGVSNDCPDAVLPDDTPCSDEQFCNGEEKCQTGICTAGGIPCPTSGCDDSIDMCVPLGCAASPQSECRTALKSQLLIKDKSRDAKDKLIWKWLKGTATPQDFADPTATANYSLCIYSGATADLAAEILVPFGAKWSQRSKGYKYFDAGASADGIQKIMLKGNATSAKAAVLAKGRGSELPDVTPVSAEQMLDLPVKVQLINQSDGTCFEGHYESARRNTAAVFKAKQ
jgi:hypothetical protein